MVDMEIAVLLITGVVAVVLTTKGASARNIYVSSKTGNNHDGCGSRIKPCLTFNGAYETSMSGDTILLDANSIHHMRPSITIDNDVSITKYPSNNGKNPVLKSYGGAILVGFGDATIDISFVDMEDIQIMSVTDEHVNDRSNASSIGNFAASNIKLSISHGTVSNSTNFINLDVTRIQIVEVILRNMTISGSYVRIFNTESDKQNLTTKAVVGLKLQDVRFLKLKKTPINFVCSATTMNITSIDIVATNVAQMEAPQQRFIHISGKTKVDTKVYLGNAVFSNCQASSLTMITFQDCSLVLHSFNAENSKARTGITIVGVSVTVQHLQMKNSMFLSTGIEITKESNIQIVNIKAASNTFVSHGLLVKQSSTVHIQTMQMIANSVYYNSLFTLDHGYMSIMKSLVQSNRMSRGFDVQYSNLFFSGSTFKENMFNEAIYTKGSTLTMKQNSFEGNRGLSFMYFLQSNITLLSNRIFSDVAPTAKAVYYNTKNTENLVISIKDLDISFNKGFMRNPIFDLKLGSSRAEVSKVNIDLKFWKAGMMVSQISSDFSPSIDILHIVSNLTIQCPDNYLTSKRTDITLEERITMLSCTKCARGLYSLDRDIKSFWFNLTSIHRQHLFKEKSTTILQSVCNECPVGGVCIDQIKSKANFYGYVTKNNTAKFRPCPTGYCCLHAHCKSINSCQRSRTGTLCGACKKDHFESYFSTDCVSKASCSKTSTFWVVFVVLAFVLTTGIFYGDQIKILLGKLRSCLSCLPARFQRKSQDMTDTVNKDSESDNEQLIHLTDLLTGETNDRPNNIILIAREPAQPIATASGIFHILISFYQIKQLIRVHFDNSKMESRVSFFLSKLFNLDLIVTDIKSLCPTSDLTPIKKGLIKNFLMAITMILIVVFFFVVYALGSFIRRKTKSRKHNNNNEEKGDEEEGEETRDQTCQLKFRSRLALCYIKILMFCYKNIATFSIVLFHCVKIGDDYVLFILGDEVCFQWWQKLDAAFFVVWVLLFPFALSVSYRMFMEDKISLFEFLVCITFVPSLVWFKLKRKNTTSTRLVSESSQKENVANVLAPMFEESYRRVSGKTFIFWETWRLYQRLILALVTTLESNPVIRICYISPVILAFVFVYIIIRPYKKELIVLHWMEVIMLLGFCFQVVSNMFGAFLYVFDIPNNNPIPLSIIILQVMDYMISPLLVLLYFYILKPASKVLGKICCR